MLALIINKLLGWNLNRKTTISLFLFCFTIIFYGFAHCQAEDNKTTHNDLKIELSCNKTEFIQGESIDLLIKIKNNLSDTINIDVPRHYL